MGDNIHILKQRLREVRDRIRAAEKAAGRSPGEVALLAVSKAQPADAVLAVSGLGQRLFGESYLQEGLEKIQAAGDRDIEWHFIGPIQSNKTRGIAERFQWVQSVDRAKILRRLHEQRPAELPPLNVCLQVNISGEAQKSGAPPERIPELAEAAAGCDRLRLRGVMTIPAPGDGEAGMRAAFARTRELYLSLREAGHGLDTLSMGMSGDLEQAVAEGATMVRVGTAVFGPREG